MKLDYSCLILHLFIILARSWLPAAGLSVDDDANDDSVETNGRGENDDDEHANKRAAILWGDESGWGAEHADANSTEDIWEADSHTDPEGGIAWVLSSLVA